jgi:hypothetical protein
MIDRQFAHRLWNWATKLGVALVLGSLILFVVGLFIFGVANNLGFGPFAAPLMLLGLIFLAIGGSLALRGVPQPPN